MWLVRYALLKPYSIGALALLISIMGFLSLKLLPVDVLPSVNIPAVKVIWTYNGLNAQEMVGKITSFSELSIMNNVDNVREVRSQTKNGVAVVWIDFQPYVDVELALSQITSVSQTILKRLPPGTNPPLIIQYDQSSTPILQLVMVSDTVAESELSDFARLQLRSMIQTIPGIRLSLPYGGSNRQIMVDIRPQALLAFGLSSEDVVNALNRQNSTLPSGTIREDGHEIQISVDSSVASSKDFNFLPIRSVNGRMILLRDIADVRDGPALQTNLVRVNGQNAVMVSLIKLGNASSLRIIDAVLKKLPEIQKAAPKGITISPIFDQSLFIRAALHHVEIEMIIVGVLVALVVLLFLNSGRAALTVLASIPLSLLSAIIALNLTGSTINLISLGGLALAIGILVDNALVEIENIKRLLATGLPPLQAALTSAQQVAFPEFVSTLSTCIVFTPIFLLTGVAGYIFKPLAIVVITALAMSYFLSRTVVPVLAVMLVAQEKQTAGLLARSHDKIQQLMEKAGQKISASIIYLNKHIWQALTILGSIFALGMIAMIFIGHDFFPKTDAGLMRIYVRTAPGNRLEATAQQFAEIQRTIRSIIPADELQFVVDVIGTPDPVNLGWIDSSVLGSYDGEILIQLKTDHQPLALYEQKIRTEIGQKFPQVFILFQPADITNQTLAGAIPSALDVRFSGKNKFENLALAHELINRMKKVPAAVDVQLQQVLTLPEYFISIDKIRALQLGITTQQAVNGILGMLGSAGTVLPNYWVDPSNGISYTVQIQTPIQQLTSIDDLMNLKLSSSKGDQEILLRSIANVTPREVPAALGRATLQPVFDVLVNPNNTDLGTLAAKTNAIVNQLRSQLLPGNQITIVGQAASMERAYGDLIQGFILALALIYLVMVFNFQSWLLPLIALAAAPIAVAGGMICLWITRTSLSVQALMGFIMIIGVSTANSVLVTSFAANVWREGKSSLEAARTAAIKRVRPVIMTALTMIIGVTPMALALGAGGEQNAPLARVVIGGLLLATVASLFIVPWLFSILMKNKTRPETIKLVEPVPETGSLNEKSI